MTPARRFLPPSMLSPLPEDVFPLQERKTRAVGVASVSTPQRALCPPSPALGSQTSGHHQAWAAAVQEGIRFNSWTSSFFFKFLAFSHARGDVHVDKGRSHTLVASPKRVLLVLSSVSKGLKTNFISAPGFPGDFSQLFIGST